MKSTSSKIFVFFIILSIIISSGTVFAADISVSPGNDAAVSVTIKNFADMKDTIEVSGLSPGDIIKVYDNTTAKLIGSKTVSSRKTEAIVTVSQLGTEAGTVLISRTTRGMLESTKDTYHFSAEITSDPLDPSQITITNNGENRDVIEITNLSEKDVIKVYPDNISEKYIAKGRVSRRREEVTIKIKQIGEEAGSLYFSITEEGKLESNRIVMPFGQEAKSSNLDPDQITITNNAGEYDVIHVSGLVPDDIIKVYKSTDSYREWGYDKVSRNRDDATISIRQIGEEAGSLFISLTSYDKQESDRIEKSFGAEAKSTPLDASNISIINNAEMADIINITGLSAHDEIKVYADDTTKKVLGRDTVSLGHSDASIRVRQVGAEAGNIYVSITEYGLQESDRTVVAFASEVVSSTPSAISVVNNTVDDDTVTVSGLSEGDIVKVYASETDTRYLGKEEVEDGETEVTVDIKRIKTDTGNIYVSLTEKGKQESGRVEVSFPLDDVSASPSAINITVQNNAGEKDVVTVKELSKGDLIKIYEDAVTTEVLAQETLSRSSSDEVTLNIRQLGISPGSIYVTLTSPGMQESLRVEKTYAAEQGSVPPLVSNTLIINNIGEDLVVVYGLQEDDIVKVYNAQVDGTVIGKDKVGDEETYSVISINQIGELGGSIYISVTSDGMYESALVEVPFLAE